MKDSKADNYSKNLDTLKDTRRGSPVSVPSKRLQRDSRGEAANSENMSFGKSLKSQSNQEQYIELNPFSFAQTRKKNSQLSGSSPKKQ